MSYTTATEDTVRRLHAGGASDSLLADYEAIANGEAGLSQAELYAKQKSDRLENHRKNKHTVQLVVTTNPAHEVYVGVAGGQDRPRAPYLGIDLRRAGVQCQNFFDNFADEDEYQVTTVAGIPPAEWPDRLTKILGEAGYGTVSREEIQWSPVVAAKLNANVVGAGVEDFIQ